MPRRMLGMGNLIGDNGVFGKPFQLPFYYGTDTVGACSFPGTSPIT